MITKNKGYVIVIMLCMILAFYSISNYFDTAVLPVTGISTPVFADAGDGISKMKIVTYNIHIGRDKGGKYDLDRIIENIKKEKPDIVALQEVDRYLARSGFQDQALYIAEKLSMNCAYGKSLNTLWGAYGNAILSKYPIVNCENYALPSDGERRTVLEASLIVNDKNIKVFNTHLGLHEEERKKQVDKLITIIKKSKAPFILLGDFNAPVDQLNKLSSEMNDSGSGKDEIPTIIYESGEGYRIDYIFLAPQLKSSDYRVVQSDASDHNMVVSEAAIP